MYIIIIITNKVNDNTYSIANTSFRKVSETTAAPLTTVVVYHNKLRYAIENNKKIKKSCKMLLTTKNMCAILKLQNATKRGGEDGKFR